MGNTIKESTPLKNPYNQRIDKKNINMIRKVLLHIYLILISLFCLMPIYFMITYATRDIGDMLQGMAFLPGSGSFII